MPSRLHTRVRYQRAHMHSFAHPHVDPNAGEQPTRARVCNGRETRNVNRNTLRHLRFAQLISMCHAK